MSEYLRHGMCLVYLDQCVVSRLIDKARNKSWENVRAAIFAAHERRRLLSPNSLEHLVETAAMQDGDAVEADRILRRLSCGWCLENEARLLARQIFAAIKGVPITRGHFLVKKALNPLTKDGILGALRKMKSEMDSHNAWMMQGANEINAVIRDGKRGNGRMRKIMIDRTLVGFAKRLREAIMDAIANRRFEIRADRYRSNLRDWPSTIIYLLAKEHRFGGAAFAQLYQKLLTEGVSFIPLLRVKGELQAYQFSVRAQMDPDDQYDITRISCVLPYADILIADGEKAHALRELGLDKEFRVEVFSTKAGERTALADRLKALAA
ncbi:MAG TPA: hypothetical protein VFX07_14395 [Candidatus Udaeobacter sp.]|nr:hypothetical protein [Candidatus Udaeobacter sp.]